MLDEDDVAYDHDDEREYDAHDHKEHVLCGLYAFADISAL